MPEVLWNSLTAPGHDACRFMPTHDGWEIAGTAAFLQDSAVAGLSYRLNCDRNWHSRNATIEGWLGARSVSLQITCDKQCQVNGLRREDLDGLVDIDLGFTPASNSNAIRRMQLAIGETASSEAIWLDSSDWSVKRLPQTYRRLDEGRYHYASPLHGYQAILQVTPFGIVSDYPGLWRMVSGA